MIILREISISILRIFYSNRSNKEVVNVDKFGKFKTTFQMISVSFLIVISEKNSFFYFLEILLIFTSVLSIASLLNYLLKWKSNSGE
jgi:phosphatidylglycerophosphate synthase